jgi:hypothetical protein
MKRPSPYEVLSPRNAPAAPIAITSSSERFPRAAWIPHTISAVSLGSSGKTASPRQIPNRIRYVQFDPVRTSIRFWKMARTRAEPA